MGEPRRITTVWAFTACYRDSFIIFARLQILFGCKNQEDEVGGHDAPTGKSRKLSIILFRMLGKIKCGIWKTKCSLDDKIKTRTSGKNSYFPLIRHRPHRKRCVQQFFYCWVCISCRANVFTEPLPSNDRGVHRLMGGFYEIHHRDRLRWHDIHTKCHKDWFKHQNLIGGIHRHRQHDILMSTFFFQNKESMLIYCVPSYLVLFSKYN
jgi:hypothetical protein